MSNSDDDNDNDDDNNDNENDDGDDDDTNDGGVYDGDFDQENIDDMMVGGHVQYMSSNSETAHIHPQQAQRLYNRCTTTSNNNWTASASSSAVAAAVSSAADLTGRACPSCNNVYKNFNHMKRHLQYECGKPPSLKCAQCFSKFKRPDSLRRHMQNSCHKRSGQDVELAATSAFDAAGGFNTAASRM